MGCQDSHILHPSSSRPWLLTTEITCGSAELRRSLHSLAGADLMATATSSKRVLRIYRLRKLLTATMSDQSPLPPTLDALSVQRTGISSHSTIPSRKIWSENGSRYLEMCSITFNNQCLSGHTVTHPKRTLLLATCFPSKVCFTARSPAEQLPHLPERRLITSSWSMYQSTV